MKDTGIGIDAKDFEAITEGFFQTEAGKKEAKGFGVGLKIVNKMLLAHHSTLKISSTPGHGSTLEFII